MELINYLFSNTWFVATLIFIGLAIIIHVFTSVLPRHMSEEETDLNEVIKDL